MRAAGRLGRGEQARVAALVRSLVNGGADTGADTDVGAGTGSGPVPADPAARTAPAGFDAEPGRGGLASALRWSPNRRAGLALGLLVVLVLAGVGWWLASSRPQQLPLTTAPPDPTVAASAAGQRVPASATSGGRALAAPASTSSAASGGPPSATVGAVPLVIDVAGKVQRPGVYRLPPGSRVFQAIRAAGGVRRGVSTQTLNLAAVLHDGEQIVVGVAGVPPTSGDPASPGGPSTGTTSGAAQVVNINTATLDQLESLPGVGPVLGQHILDYRDAHGQFASLDQLQSVSGIGPAKYAAMKALVSL